MKKIFCILITIILGVSMGFSQSPRNLDSLIEESKLIAEKEEEPLVKTIALFQSKISELEGVEKAILHSMIAECVWSYLSQNRYDILRRTTLAEPDLTDIRTWDIRLLLQQCIAHYQASLEPREELQKTPVRKYTSLLNLGDSASARQRPTLFDLLAFRAIQSWNSDWMRLTQPMNAFVVDNPQYFLRAEAFANLDISSTDTLSLDYQILYAPFTPKKIARKF